MIECIDTIVPRPGPLEQAAARVSAGLVQAARATDRGLVRALDFICEWRARSAERDVMRSLDDRMLRDVGLNRCDVERELRKPFWER